MYIERGWGGRLDHTTIKQEKEVRMIKCNKGKAKAYISAFLVYQRKMGYGFTQTDIAKETGLAQAQLSDYENEKKLPSLPAIIALADMFDVSIDYLVGRCENKEAHKTKKGVANVNG